MPGTQEAMAEAVPEAMEAVIAAATALAVMEGALEVGNHQIYGWKGGKRGITISKKKSDQ